MLVVRVLEGLLHLVQLLALDLRALELVLQVLHPLLADHQLVGLGVLRHPLQLAVPLLHLEGLGLQDRLLLHLPHPYVPQPRRQQLLQRARLRGH